MPFATLNLLEMFDDGWQQALLGGNIHWYFGTNGNLQVHQPCLLCFVGVLEPLLFVFCLKYSDPVTQLSIMDSYCSAKSNKICINVLRINLP